MQIEKFKELLEKQCRDPNFTSDIGRMYQRDFVSKIIDRFESKQSVSENDYNSIRNELQIHIYENYHDNHQGKWKEDKNGAIRLMALQTLLKEDVFTAAFAAERALEEKKANQQNTKKIIENSSLLADAIEQQISHLSDAGEVVSPDELTSRSKHLSGILALKTIAGKLRGMSTIGHVDLDEIVDQALDEDHVSSSTEAGVTLDLIKQIVPEVTFSKTQESLSKRR